MVTRALHQAGPASHVLDCPCGAGRLVPLLLDHAERVTAVDASEAMLTEARRALSGVPEAAGRLSFGVAAADRLPYEDDAFDVAVCHRLLHHVQGAADRARILGELARVASKAVVLSFSDATPWKLRWLRARGRAHRRVTWTPVEIEAEAAAVGLRLEPPVRRVASVFSLVAVGVFRPDRRP